MTAKKKGEKRLSAKEKGFVKDIAAGMTGTDAILNNYDTDSPKVAGVMAVENLAKPRILTALADALPDELIKEKHLALLNRMETITEVDPNTKEVRYKASEQIHVQAVSKGLELAYKVKGAFIDPMQPAPGAGNTYNFFYKPEIKKTTDEFEERLKKILYEDKEQNNG